MQCALSLPIFMQPLSSIDSTLLPVSQRPFHGRSRTKEGEASGPGAQALLVVRAREVARRQFVVVAVLKSCPRCLASKPAGIRPAETGLRSATPTVISRIGRCSSVSVPRSRASWTFVSHQRSINLLTSLNLLSAWAFYTPRGSTLASA